MLAAEAGRVFFGSNLHVLISGQAYRSAQLSSKELEQVINSRGIRTVINLRGCCDPWPWYLEECRATHRCQIAQEDICLSSGRLPSTHEIRRLVQVLDRTEYPVILHCRRGADRTGLASTILLLLHTELDLSSARHQLGVRYGHLALGRPAYLDEFFELYVAWLRNQAMTHSQQVFRRWLEQEYCPGECRCTMEFLEKPDYVFRGEPSAIRIRARNDGIKPWRFRPGTDAGIHACLILRDWQGNTLGLHRAGLFDAEAPVGASIDLVIPLPAIATAGHYQLFIDMIDEQASFFYQAGSEPLEAELEVR